jgi:hypothetical protein
MAGRAAEQEKPIMRKSTRFIAATVGPGGRGVPQVVVGSDRIPKMTSYRSSAHMRQL